MPDPVVINGAEFAPIEGIRYRYDYVKAANIINQRMEEGGDSVILARRMKYDLVLNDLFFVVHFILKPILNGRNLSNHKFVVDACREVESGPKDCTLDVWAREHFKSTIITLGETIQYAMKHKNSAQGIFSYKKAIADDWLMTIMDVLEHDELLLECFPHILHDNPKKDALAWGLEKGIYLKRDASRPAPSIGAYGLIDGMPTGKHLDRRVYDDISTDDLANTADIREKVKRKLDLSQNLGTDEGTHRIVGTFYDYRDALVYSMEKTDDSGNKIYTLRKKPGTDNGQRDGNPVLVTKKRLRYLKSLIGFESQILCDPNPPGTKKFEGVMIRDIEPDKIPENLWLAMVVDPAGDSKDEKKGDAWALGVFGVTPEADANGMRDIYIKDLMLTPLAEASGYDESAKMYVRNGLIQKLGVEKVALSSTETHIAERLKKQGITVSEDAGNLVILKPAGRKKDWRIEKNLSMPMIHGKIHMSTSIPAAYRARLRMEFDNFPRWHDDGADILAYLMDMVADYIYEIEGMEAVKGYKDSYEAGLSRNAHSGQGKAANWMAA